jgi:hypothetical protein
MLSSQNLNKYLENSSIKHILHVNRKQQEQLRNKEDNDQIKKFVRLYSVELDAGVRCIRVEGI